MNGDRNLTEIDSDALHASARNTVQHLLSARKGDTVWEGFLSSSAVATAVAVFALSRADMSAHRVLIRKGIDWLVCHANPDGGWGDSPDSPTNITATILAWCALAADESRAPHVLDCVRRAEVRISSEANGLGPDALLAALQKRYGNDLTFCGPILTMCALSGRLGNEQNAWRFVPQLPFELSVMPHRVFRWLRLTVVSYALPALVAVGLVRHRKRPSRFLPARILRNVVTGRALRIAESMQPANGGYEEATPLTGFVTMCLVGAGLREHSIVRRCASFLTASARTDGSWPIDTNLSTWLTAFSINALARHPGWPDTIPPETRSALKKWLLNQQYTEMHPLTFGLPGGWGWSDLPGAMPDSDDTSAVLLAIRHLDEIDDNTRAAAIRGITWLLNLQNADGGIPTFSRGWGKLPFDRSCPDITAHAMQAFVTWRNDIRNGSFARRIDNAVANMVHYLETSMGPEGCWRPLWFGDQQAPDEANFTHGTARVVLALRDCIPHAVPGTSSLISAGERWLISAQNDDGGWGSSRGIRSSVEETCLAVAALAGSGAADAVGRGTGWIMLNTENGTRFPFTPIGLYFARLWYSESLYPVVFATLAFGELTRRKT